MPVKSRKSSWVVLVCLLSGCVGCARPRPPVVAAGASQGVSLPLRRVRFYAAGVAELERAGRVSGGVARLLVSEAHLHDALATLRVYRAGAEAPSVTATISSLATGEPAARLDYQELLQSLEGETIEVSLGERVESGRLLHVGEITASDATRPEFELTLLDDDGAIQRISSSKLTRVALLEPGVLARLRRGLAARAASIRELPRELRVVARPGEALQLSYLEPVPVVRMTYRLSLAEQPASAELHGLALLHNDSDEPWRSVEVTVASGEPAVTLRSLLPPRAATDIEEEAKPPERTAPNQRGAARYAYRLPAPLDLEPHAAALATFVRTKIKVERGVTFQEHGALWRSGIRLENVSGQALPEGAMAVFEGGHLLGEVELAEVPAGGVRYYDLPAPLDMTLEAKPAPAPTLVYDAVSWDGELVLRAHQVRPHAYELTNTGHHDALAFVGLGSPAKVSVTGADWVDSVTPSLAVAVLRVPARQRVQRRLEIREEQVLRVGADSVEPTLLVELLQVPTLSSAVRLVLQEALPLSKRRAQLTLEKTRLEERQTNLEDESSRLSGTASEASPMPAPIAARFVALELERSKLVQRSSALQQALEENVELASAAFAKLPRIEHAGGDLTRSATAN
jgi:hypothetical protein